MRLRLVLDPELADRLAQAAERDRRPIDMEAEVLLRFALGLAGCPLCGREAGREIEAQPGREVGDGR